MVEKLENGKLDFGDLKMLISPVQAHLGVQDELGQDELGDAFSNFGGSFKTKMLAETKKYLFRGHVVCSKHVLLL